MTGPSREERTLAQLLKVARAKAELLEMQVRDLENARRTAESSLEWLAQAIQAEERPHGDGFVPHPDFTSFLEGANAKRAALEATRATLSDKIESANEALAEAREEMEKLQRLVGHVRRGPRGKKEDVLSPPHRRQG